MTAIVTFQKYPQERKRLYIDYACFLEESETLSEFQATITPASPTPLSLTMGYTDGAKKKLTMFAQGGDANTGYIIALLVLTSGGVVKRDDIGMRVTA